MPLIGNPFFAHPQMQLVNLYERENEELLLNDKIKFTDIYKIVDEALSIFNVEEELSIDNIIKYDKIVKDWVYKTYNK